MPEYGPELRFGRGEEQMWWGRIASLLVTVIVGSGLAPELGYCGSDEPEGASSSAYFETHVRPILVQRCYSCHSEQSGKREGGLFLDAAEAWLEGGERGAAIIPGDADGSLMIQAVRYTDADFSMPPTEKLGDEQIAVLEEWVRMGAPAPAGRYAAPLAAPSDPVAGRDHWAMRPLAAGDVPAVKDSGWPLGTIDRYLLAALEGQQLHPGADASPEALLRRVCFQLTGLPATEEQRQRFLADPSAEGFARLVDELLGSAEFGRRWGRHWLDLARYADSNGLDENFLFREAWRYRNWVIDAVNADMPFDRFLLEQLAGDLLPFETTAQRDRQRIAAGFLVIGPKVLLGVNPDKQRMDVADEQLETIGRVVLAQTLGCARCHDHKFDPIPTSDYYAMAGILTSTVVMQQRYMLGEQRVMERLVGLGDEGEDLNAAYEKYWRERAGLKQELDSAKEALELLKGTDAAGLAQKIRDDAESFAAGAIGDQGTQAEKVAAQEMFVAGLKERYEKPPAIPPRAMIPADGEQIRDESIRRAGRFDDPAEIVPRGFLLVLQDGEAQAMTPAESGRRALATWLTDPAGRAGMLTARVQANRIWHHLMGSGLVRTVDNFGRTGEQPSHPELLDYLAGRLISSGWSRKALIREIVLSRAFGLSSGMIPECRNVDPENRLYWRANRRRLDPESLRDAMLTAAGTLDLQPMESTVSYLGDQATAVGSNPVRRRTDYQCRSIYLPVIRNDLPELFDVFDFANPHTATGARPQTNVPTQSLYLLNDPMVMAAAEATAKRMLAETGECSLETRIDHLFRLITGGNPGENERRLIADYLRAMARVETPEDPSNVTLSMWARGCQAIFASSRFQYLD